MSFQTGLEVQAFRLPLAAAVATKIGVFGFGFHSEDELRASIQEKDQITLSLMDAYFSKLVERAQASDKGEPEGGFWKLSEACEAARQELVKRTVELSK